MIPILPTIYFGSLEYFWYLANNKQVIIDVSEKYVKQTFRNRCQIIGPNGLLNLTVPVERPNGQYTDTKDVLISNNEDWRKTHWRTLESCYKRSPYFEFYEDELKEIFYSDHKALHQLNKLLTLFFIKKIGIDCLIIDDAKLNNDEYLDLRKEFSPKQISKFRNYEYLQTFVEKHGHQFNLSILDLLFNEGPNAICILEESKFDNK